MYAVDVLYLCGKHCLFIQNVKCGPEWIFLCSWYGFLLLCRWVCFLDTSVLWLESLSESSRGVTDHWKTFIHGPKAGSLQMNGQFFFNLLTTSMAPWVVLLLPRLFLKFVSRRAIGKESWIENAAVSLASHILRWQEQAEGKCGQQTSGAPARFSLNTLVHYHPLFVLTLWGREPLSMKPSGILVGRRTPIRPGSGCCFPSLTWQL